MGLLKLYIRREPSGLRDPRSAGTQRRDRVLYRDAQATDPVGLYPWWRSSGPNRRSSRIVHNCFLYELVWLNDVSPARSTSAGLLVRQ